MNVLYKDYVRNGIIICVMSKASTHQNKLLVRIKSMCRGHYYWHHFSPTQLYHVTSLSLQNRTKQDYISQLFNPYISFSNGRGPHNIIKEISGTSRCREVLKMSISTGALTLTVQMGEMFSGHSPGFSFLCRTFPRVTEHLCCHSQSTLGNVQAFSNIKG